MRRFGMLLVWAACLWLTSLDVVQAQNAGSVRGRVTGEDGRALAGAQVMLVGSTRGTLTNAQGQYMLLGVPAGSHTIEVRQIGFRAGRANVQVTGAGAVQNFTLTQEAVELERVVVSVGSRAAHTAAQELAVPVDVFPITEIQSSTAFGMTEILAELSPSINFDRPQIADLTSGVRPFQMRGLSPDHSLVLVNGKRRHPTSVVHVFGSAAMTSGSSGVDMNAIPSMALGQMEILRDGAAAQYGSDAIAGVINMGLKNTISAPSFTATYGMYETDFLGNSLRDGQRWDLAGNVGLPLMQRGTLNLTAQYTDRNMNNRSCPDNRAMRDYAKGTTLADEIDWEGCRVTNKRNPVPQPTTLRGDGESKNLMLFGNAELPLVGFDEGPVLYAFGGYSQRQDLHSGGFRVPQNAANWPGQYPLGFLPFLDSKAIDAQAVLGLRGNLGAWRWDLSQQYGHNTNDVGITNSLNASLGPCFAPAAPCAPGVPGQPAPIANKTEFDAGAIGLRQLLTDFDITRTFEVGLAAPLNVALGSSFRADNYWIQEGEPASWMNGGHRNHLNTAAAAAGSQVFFGYTPDQTMSTWRNNLGVWADLETDLHSMFRVATAARFENYSDFGSTLTGKVAARFQPFEQLILRSAVSTGFRAPSLSQSYYTHISTSWRTNATTGEQEQFELGEFSVHSPEAKALGAKPLKEERSRNFSAGFAATPFSGFNFTGDVYLIRVDDRIVLSNTLAVNSSTEAGRRIQQLLAPYGAEAVKYFMNAFHTETRGLDLTASYRLLFGENRLLETSVAYNYNEQKLIGDIVTPDILLGMGTLIFPEATRVAIEKGRPRDRVNGRMRYTHGPIKTSLVANYYGEITSLLQEVPTYELQVNPGKWITDADVAFQLPRGLELAVGADNLFDIYPARNPHGFDASGGAPYNSGAWGRNGRFVWTRMRVNF
jgi:iron complex outermembrane recepter protein